MRRCCIYAKPTCSEAVLVSSAAMRGCSIGWIPLVVVLAAADVLLPGYRLSERLPRMELSLRSAAAEQEGGTDEDA
jgi:hypothetical protein